MNIQPQAATDHRNLPTYFEWLALEDSDLAAQMKSIAEGLESGRIIRSADLPLAFLNQDPLWVLCWRTLSPLEITSEESQKSGGELWEFYLLDYALPLKANGRDVYHARTVGRRTRKGLIDGWDYEQWKLCSKTDTVWTVLGGVEESRILATSSLEKEDWHLNYSEFFDRALRKAIVQVQAVTYSDVYK